MMINSNNDNNTYCYLVGMDDFQQGHNVVLDDTEQSSVERTRRTFLSAIKVACSLVKPTFSLSLLLLITNATGLTE